MTAPAGQRIKDRVPAYVWGNLDAPKTSLLRANTAWPKNLARFRKPQWRFPVSLIDPLIWYWAKLVFYDEPEASTGRHAAGTSWLEIAMDFETSTRIPLSRGGPDNATEHMRERAVFMSNASKALLRGLGAPPRSCHTIHCRSIQAFRSKTRAGLRYRPTLLCPEAVGYELGMQVMLHPVLMGVEATQWKWRRNLRILPPAIYPQQRFLNQRLYLRRPTRLSSKTRLTPGDV
jgi:hypothetical protein